MTEYPQLLVNLPVRDKLPIAEVPILAEAIARVERELADRGRALVRYSGTEKKIRLMVECRDAAVARRHLADLRTAVEETIGA